MYRTVALLVVTAVAFPSAARSEVVRRLGFDVDGVLPSAESDIEFFTNSGSSEAALYSVTGGLLKQSTLSTVGNSSYGFPNSSLTGGTLDSALMTVLETRFTVLDNIGAGGFIQAWDGAHRYSMFVVTGGVSLRANPPLQPVTVDTSEPHTYRLAANPSSGQMVLFVDGVEAASAAIEFETGFNGFGWGDGITAAGNGAVIDWDFVEISQAAIPVPTMSVGSYLVVIAAIAVASLGLMDGRPRAGATQD